MLNICRVCHPNIVSFVPQILLRLPCDFGCLVDWLLFSHIILKSRDRILHLIYSLVICWTTCLAQWQPFEGTEKMNRKMEIRVRIKELHKLAVQVFIVVVITVNFVICTLSSVTPTLASKTENKIETKEYILYIYLYKPGCCMEI